MHIQVRPIRKFAERFVVSLVVGFLAFSGLLQTGVYAAESRFPEGMVSLNFDDGTESQYQIAAPKLDAAGFKGSFYIITRTLSGTYPAYMGQEQVLNLAERGHEIGAHTRSHAHLHALDDSQVLSEIAGSKDDLESIGLHPATFAYPFGEYNAAITAVVRASGFIGARTTDFGINDRNADPYRLTRMRVRADTTYGEVKAAIDANIVDKKWLILVFHGLDETDSFSTTSQVFDRILAYLAEKQVKVVNMEEGVRQLNRYVPPATPTPTPLATPIPTAIPTPTPAAMPQPTATSTPENTPTPTPAPTPGPIANATPTVSSATAASGSGTSSGSGSGGTALPPNRNLRASISKFVRNLSSGELSGSKIADAYPEDIVEFTIEISPLKEVLQSILEDASSDPLLHIIPRTTRVNGNLSADGMEDGHVSVPALSANGPALKVSYLAKVVASVPQLVNNEATLKFDDGGSITDTAIIRVVSASPRIIPSLTYEGAELSENPPVFNEAGTEPFEMTAGTANRNTGETILVSEPSNEPAVLGESDGTWNSFIDAIGNGSQTEAGKVQADGTPARQTASWLERLWNSIIGFFKQVI